MSELEVYCVGSRSALCRNLNRTVSELEASCLGSKSVMCLIRSVLCQN